MTRWVVVDGETGKAPAGLRGRTSWPTERLARAAAEPGEVARRMTVAGPAGPFADVLYDPGPNFPWEQFLGMVREEAEK